MDNQHEIETCDCFAKKSFQPQTLLATSRVTAKSIPSVLLSILIAFFPKCPVCWAIYMSMFGSLGLTRLPYVKWLLPVLIIFLGIHLFFLYRRIKIAGRLPFFMSVAGAVVIIYSRMFFSLSQLPLIIGITCVIAGSLLNSFPKVSFYLTQKDKHLIHKI